MGMFWSSEKVGIIYDAILNISNSQELLNLGMDTVLTDPHWTMAWGSKCTEETCSLTPVRILELGTWKTAAGKIDEEFKVN